ncbi:hypothetical protein HOP50_01g08820 [Chloropicon primus]|nr:hypothetical protein HOP50_01g08820 [Chloropicon primus]
MGGNTNANAEMGGSSPSGGGRVEVDEASVERLGNQIKDVMRKAMRDLIDEEVSKGEYDHVLRLWKEVRERLMRLSQGSKEREKTKAAIDCEYAEELVRGGALDNTILADMVQLASRRIGELGAVAYERQVLNWGVKLADELRSYTGQGNGEGEAPRSPAELLAHFFDECDVLLTRIEAGVAAHLLCQALLSGIRA